jgi:carbon-monoxide dehydrogenase medium subunit
MKPAPFTYHAPKTVDEALKLLAEVAEDDGRVLAGGQSLVPTMAFRLARPKHLIDINGVKELDFLEIRDGKLLIGAGVRHAAFEKAVEEGPLGRLLMSVVRHVAHRPIRARGTFCGSIAHADPASEWCAVAAALDAEMVLESKRGGLRVVAARDFFKGIMATAIKEEELLTEVRVPILPPDACVGFSEFSRRAGDYAIAMAVAAFRLKGGVMTEVKIAIGGAEARPRRMTEAERSLIGQPPNLGGFQAAAHTAVRALDPLDDAAVSADYRRGIARAMVVRALAQASGADEPAVDDERADDGEPLMAENES